MTWNDIAFSEYCTEPYDKAHSDGTKIWQNRMIREGDWKLIRNYDDNSLELYNLPKDLSEEKNVAKQNSKLATQQEVQGVRAAGQGAQRDRG